MKDEIWKYIFLESVLFFLPTLNVGLLLSD